MRKTCCILILCFSYFGAAAQNVAVVNGHPISQREFVWIYKKHRPENVKPTMTELVSFLNLYIDFKLKVQDAEEAQMDKDSTYIAEVNTYEQTLLASVPPEVRNADYSLVINEYKEALLLFNISERKVWDRLENNESTIKAYYDAHPELYASLPFEEVKGEVAIDYQKKLECEWITELRNKYPITIDQKLLSALIK